MYIDFTICSSENNLTEVARLFPDSKLILKGNKLKLGGYMQYNEMSLKYERSDISYIDDLLSSFKIYIGEHLAVLVNFIHLNKLTPSICIVIKESEEKPALSITNENLNLLCNLNASLDFDFI
ncbi:hypothetical protein [Treponema parvum]|uniref:hypothetical protein n=1 Tax=Treponema parvum TaxID=138851 RepID=UPI001AEBE49A|nr:hypothetical protein [Treponema parvum]QTQ16345.1 hypothetical protein HXT04_06380 [Treponema parvum]